MAIREILQIPHPILRMRAKKVRSIDGAVLHLAQDMVDTMRKAEGVGLAANQVGVLSRVIVIQLQGEDEARVYVNPEIVQRNGERQVEEGCLSIAGYKGIVTRSVWVKFRALDHTATLVKLKAEDVLSQALEHEVDHLNGILYIDHMESHEKLIKVEPEPTDSDSGEARQDAATDDVDDANPQSHESRHSDLWIPDDVDDPRNTPASIKVK